MTPRNANSSTELETLGSDPHFRLNENILQNRFLLFASQFTVYYPIKANNKRPIVDRLKSYGSSFEVDSIELLNEVIEYDIASTEILYSFLQPTPEEIKIAINAGVRKFVVDSLEIAKEVTAHKCDCMFIVRIAVSELVSEIDPKDWSKWGATIHEVKQIIEYLRSDRHAKSIGVGFYLPKKVYSASAFRECLKSISNNFGSDSLDCLNIGGGLEDFESREFRDDVRKACRLLKVNCVICEPGRRLLNPSVDLIASVKSIRKKNGRTWVMLNVGIYDGLLDAKFERRRFELEFPEFESTDGHDTFDALVIGPTSDILDSLGEYKNLPCGLGPGSQVVIRRCGAYAPMLQTSFAGRRELNWKIV